MTIKTDITNSPEFSRYEDAWEMYRLAREFHADGHHDYHVSDGGPCLVCRDAAEALAEAHAALPGGTLL